MVSSKAAHPNCMYMWMDYITSPQVQAQVAYYFGEAPANPKACAEIATLYQRHDSLRCLQGHRRDVRQVDRRSGRRRGRSASNGRGERLRAVRRLDQGLDRDQGLTPCPRHCIEPGSARPRAGLHRHPRRSAGRRLIGGPAAWMLVFYIGSLASLFLTSLYRLNEDGSGIEKVISAAELPNAARQLGLPATSPCEP